MEIIVWQKVKNIDRKNPPFINVGLQQYCSQSAYGPFFCCYKAQKYADYTTAPPLLIKWGGEGGHSRSILNFLPHIMSMIVRYLLFSIYIQHNLKYIFSCAFMFKISSFEIQIDQRDISKPFLRLERRTIGKILL